MVDAALNVAAEQVIEHSAYGALLSRQGNRGPVAAPQNLYRAAAVDKYDDSWVAIAVATDEQWLALQHVLGDPDWAAAPALATATGRAAEHDRIDDALGEWCRARGADEIVEVLWSAEVPVGKVMQPHHQPELPQLAARKFFEVVDHPVAGESRYSTLAMRFSEGPERMHVRHAPLLGEHNAELLGEVGMSESDLAELETDGIIGRSVTMATGAK
jgi:crotonobetainyl-CoA:carnitine CoA-transferase CaiB-like acyl-CoA transferase